MVDEFDLESLVHVEQAFYDAGYQDGYSHGRLHGLIEGRALGREKGYEMWEELGFYEGFASTWGALLSQANVAENDRTMNNVKRLLELIHQFPKVNPSTADTASSNLDILQLLQRIRSRYKALCSSLGVQPSLRAAAQSSQDRPVDNRLDEDGQGLRSESRPNIWPLETIASRGLSY